jgi:hypothetical protein
MHSRAREANGAISAEKKPKQDASNDVGAPENRINCLERLVLTPQLPQFITPVLEPEIIRFGILKDIKLFRAKPRKIWDLNSP